VRKLGRWEARKLGSAEVGNLGGEETKSNLKRNDTETQGEYK